MPDPSLLIRDARLDDLDAIFEIEQRSFTDPYPRGLLKAFFYLPGVYIVAVSEGKVIGYAVGIVRYESLGHVVSIAVDESMRRKGVGERLMKETIERLCSKGTKRVRIEVRQSNIPAIVLYTKLGFTVEGKIKRYYADGESALLMYFNVK
ncbi:MAG: ribosomal-protein-alanine N-acetyltransferase [Candidatus Verstraetearchaeota archaeon]|nr:ribosomal-protein-alanine N-acetyltransferase [Candidatus Verstraetearchaeota archaeon]